MAQTRPYSPVDGIWVKDDFHPCKDDVSAGLCSELNWEIGTIGNASTIAYQTARGYGTMKDTTGGTADGDGEYYRSITDGLVFTNKGGGFATDSQTPSPSSRVVSAVYVITLSNISAVHRTWRICAVWLNASSRWAGIWSSMSMHRT
jgi:hypothetical protein